MTVKADESIVLMRLMTLYTFKAVGFRNMVVMRIKYVSIFIAGAVGDNVQ